MKPENDKQFIIASKAIATTYLDRLVAMGLTPNEVTNLMGGALSEILAQQLGIPQAVERLRQIADLMEKQVLDSQAEG